MLHTKKHQKLHRGILKLVRKRRRKHERG